MKNLSLILNVILLIAVAYLFVQHFAAKDGSSENAEPVAKSTTIGNIVYVNSDTLLDNFEFYQNLRSKLVKKQDSLESVLAYRGKKLEEEVRKYQETAGTMSASQRALTEDGLVKKEQRLYQQRDQLLEQLAQEESDMTDELHKKLYGFLSDYNEKKGYDFILGFQRGSGILHANDSLDITEEVLKGLNAASCN
ncbi:MAG: OmpH family outer membrane protein [Bacteroidia bacterium]|nr:OmpH family outer membrane protein [Bacteroidia bacterium]